MQVIDFSSMDSVYCTSYTDNTSFEAIGSIVSGIDDESSGVARPSQLPGLLRAVLVFRFRM